MATQSVDLWGEFEPAEGSTPLTILRGQAALLGDKTRHVVEARVDTRATPIREFVHSFRLVVPTLDHYEYELFRISHGIDLYPVLVRWKDERLELESEESFMAWLHSCLSSETTKRIISTLMGQAAA
jgi:hypothetical protein